MHTVIVYDLESARRALACAHAGDGSVRLVSPKGGVAQVGAAFYLALGRELGCEVIIDATGYPGYALEALRLGARCVLYRGDGERRKRLDQIARAMGARVYGRLPPQKKSPAGLGEAFAEPAPTGLPLSAAHSAEDVAAFDQRGAGCEQSPSSG